MNTICDFYIKLPYVYEFISSKLYIILNGYSCLSMSINTNSTTLLTIDLQYI